MNIIQTRPIFTSDTHFLHKNIQKFCPRTRPGDDYLDATEKLIDRWNSKIKPKDVVYHTGDFCFCNAVELRQILDRLNGQIHLIYGNHDQTIKSNADIRKRFVSVSDYKEIVVGNQKIVLFHFPILEWNRCFKGSWQLFGHVHGSLNHDTEYARMDIGIDAHPTGDVFTYEEVHENLKDRKFYPAHK